MDDLQQVLFRSLNKKSRPDDIAQVILHVLGERLPPNQLSLLDMLARGVLKRLLFGYTSHQKYFSPPVGLKRQVERAEELFMLAPHFSSELCDDPEALEEFIRQISLEIHKAFGSSDFKEDRLNHDARQEAGLELSKRRYNKLFRLLIRMEAKLLTLKKEIRKQQFVKISRSSLASLLPWDDFASDLDTGCFIAYYTARANRHGEFILARDAHPYDKICEMLMSRCRASPTVNWWAIAYVYPSTEVLRNLTDKQKGELLGRWFSILQDVGELLWETYERSDINLQTMIVQRGNDSSTWNATARDWNTIRNHWITLLHAMGMNDLLDTLCVGKTLPLMAGDVAARHRSNVKSHAPNTAVWNALPLPWEVLRGEQTCTREMVEEACHQYGLDPLQSGWSAPRPRTPIAQFRPTPELLHGVTVFNPFLAAYLKRTQVQ